LPHLAVAGRIEIGGVEKTIEVVEEIGPKKDGAEDGALRLCRVKLGRDARVGSGRLWWVGGAG
jgi:hypothetical protein